jgi:Ni,Fe-hydrogenase III large subunit/Ni,Fe-hydrogenase III component G
MPIKYPNLQLERMNGAIHAWCGRIGSADLQPICWNVHDGGGRLLALWGRDTREPGFELYVVLVNETGLVCLSIALPGDAPVYPDISHIFPAADRMQRATYDLLGIRAQDARDNRKWLRHAAWPVDVFPLRKDFKTVPYSGQTQSVSQMAGESDIFDGQPSDAAQAEIDFSAAQALPETAVDSVADDAAIASDAYDFVRVEGQGVHEIPVGPVHAGIIEPGHFRFSVVGEKVLRLEERLGYTHKGVEKCFERMPVQQGARLAGRVSGDSTVAYAWAYAMAAETIADITPPDRALWLRALFLERERVANHLGDLGYLGNDVAFSFGFAQFWILKEQLLRNNGILFGHRYLMDAVIPGGVSVDLGAEGKRMLEQECAMLEEQVHILHDIYEEHAGVQDRYIGAGRVEPRLAAQLGLCGLAGRASSQSWDSRVQFPCAPYDKLDVQMATHRNGDVAARVMLRFDELFESLRLQRDILVNLIGGDVLMHTLETLPANRFGIGMVEGWRGEVMVAIHTDVDGLLDRVHPHDPSWQNWPVLEHAILGDIVPDFPLINKSFNLSYSGHDL